MWNVDTGKGVAPLNLKEASQEQQGAIKDIINKTSPKYVSDLKFDSTKNASFYTTVMRRSNSHTFYHVVAPEGKVSTFRGWGEKVRIPESRYRTDWGYLPKPVRQVNRRLPPVKL
jgi:hypothetical protein